MATKNVFSKAGQDSDDDLIAPLPKPAAKKAQAKAPEAEKQVYQEKQPKMNFKQVKDMEDGGYQVQDQNRPQKKQWRPKTGGGGTDMGGAPPRGDRRDNRRYNKDDSYRGDGYKGQRGDGYKGDRGGNRGDDYKDDGYKGDGYKADRGGYNRGDGGNRGDGERKPRGDRPKGKCFNCNQEGHMAKDCPNPRKERNVEEKPCFNCGEVGHLVKDCPEPRKERGDWGGKPEKKQREPRERRERKEKPKDDSQKECYKCNQFGHIAKDCPEDIADVCYECNKAGHFARDCPERKEKNTKGGDAKEPREPKAAGAFKEKRGKDKAKYEEEKKFDDDEGGEKEVVIIGESLDDFMKKVTRTEAKEARAAEGVKAKVEASSGTNKFEKAATVQKTKYADASRTGASEMLGFNDDDEEDETWGRPRGGGGNRGGRGRGDRGSRPDRGGRGGKPKKTNFTKQNDFPALGDL